MNMVGLWFSQFSSRTKWSPQSSQDFRRFSAPKTQELEEKTAYLEKGIREVFDKHQLHYCLNRVGSMMSFHFDIDAVNNFEDARNANAELFKKLFHGVLKRGVYFAPSAFEALFISTTHTYKLLDKTIQAMDEALEEIL